MAAEDKQENTSLNVRRSVSQLSVAFAVIGLIAGIAVMSPDGRFAGFSAAALCGAVPLVLGPSGLRKYGALAALVGTAGVILLAGSGEGSLYRTKARMQAVHAVGGQYCEASADHRLRMKAWPAGVESLTVPKKPRTVSSVSFGTDGSITFILSFPPVKDGALVFTPSGVSAPIAWTCRGVNVPEAYLPAACREK
ncbi:MAG: pilin [Nitrospirota bacterium]